MGCNVAVDAGLASSVSEALRRLATRGKDWQSSAQGSFLLSSESFDPTMATRS